jgi:large subunit ribosomal protein L14
MIQKETFLKVIDNSGGRIAKCIQVYSNTNGNIGDKVLVSIQKIKKKNPLVDLKIENHNLYKGLIVQTKRGVLRNDGSNLRFNKNSIILLTRENEKLLGTRILCPLIKELKNKKFMKILTISSRIL